MARCSLGSKQSAGFSVSRWAKGPRKRRVPRKRSSAARDATCRDGQNGDLIKSSLNCRKPPGHGTCACADHDNVHVRSSRSHRLGRGIGRSERWREYLQTRACSYRPCPARQLAGTARKSTATSESEGPENPGSYRSDPDDTHAHLAGASLLARSFRRGGSAPCCCSSMESQSATLRSHQTIVALY
jgi:hypothetical protein